MDFHELAARRRSVRRYQGREVEQDKLDLILRTALLAPSAGNLQPYEIIVVTHHTSRMALARAALDLAFLAQAPAVLVFLQDPGRSTAHYGARGNELYATQDTAIACTHAQLAAASLDLGSCWVGAFHPDRVARLLGVPPHLLPVALLAVGYPNEQPAASPRRPVEEMIHRESYGRPKEID